jgi:hypothetical protein
MFLFLLFVSISTIGNVVLLQCLYFFNRTSKLSFADDDLETGILSRIPEEVMHCFGPLFGATAVTLMKRITR